jgi:hypothetical protein
MTIIFFDNLIKVVKGLDNFLFKLIILRAVKDHSGNVWRRKPTDMYVVEITTDKSFEILTAEDGISDGNYNQVSVHWVTYMHPPCKEESLTFPVSTAKQLADVVNMYCITAENFVENILQQTKKYPDVLDALWFKIFISQPFDCLLQRITIKNTIHASRKYVTYRALFS